MKAIIKKLLPTDFWGKLQETRAKGDIYLAKVSVKSRFFSSFFYTFISGQFRREHQAVLSGRLAYLKSLEDINHSSALLRRNVHRLEKGLIMEPRRATFAEAYIAETVEIFARCVEQQAFSQQELTWAYHVLTEYFSVVTETAVISQAHQVFLASIDDSKDKVSLSSVDNNDTLAKPYASDERPISSVNDQDLFALFKQRRSVRWFEDKPVQLNTIEKALDMALQAPSACNRQPFEFYTCIDPKVAAEIAGIPTGTNGFSQNVQALIVIMGDLSAYPFERDRHVIYIDSGLVAMQLMLAFESLGLSTCPINWPDIESYEKLLAERLDLPKYKRPIMMMAVGYAKATGGIPFSQKKTAAELIKVVD